MATEPLERPEFPKNVSQWWSKKMSELTPEQASIKKEYYKKYNAWKQQLKPKKETKLPKGVSKWWSKPQSELTPEQLEIKHAYFQQDHIVETRRNYTRRYNKKMREYAIKYKELMNLD